MFQKVHEPASQKINPGGDSGRDASTEVDDNRVGDYGVLQTLARPAAVKRRSSDTDLTENPQEFRLGRAYESSLAFPPTSIFVFDRRVGPEFGSGISARARR